MATVTEIAPDTYRISVYVPEFDLQFNHFLIRDEEPLLYHTGMDAMFEEVLEAAATVLGPETIRWIGFSHLESDECGALPRWLEVAPQARPVCSGLGAQINADFLPGAVLGMQDGDTLTTGEHRFRFCRTAQLPHGWDAGLLFDERHRTLLCSDLLHQNGDVEPLSERSLAERARRSLLDYEAGPLADYVPYTARTGALLRSLADLRPRTLAAMHGSSFAGDGAAELLELDAVLRDVFAPVEREAWMPAAEEDG